MAEFVSDRVDQAAQVDRDDSWSSAQEDVEQIKGATRRAADLTKQLLAFAKREIVEPQPVNLNHIIRGLEHLLRRTIGERVELVIDLAAALPLVLADPGQIEQVLVNLAVNARDAMPEGGTLTIDTATIGTFDQSGIRIPKGAASVATSAERRIRVRLADTGTGMPPEIIDRVFDPFYTTKATGDGTGLGLATVHGIVEQAGGSIEIESEPGLGTSFILEFPTTSKKPVVADEHVVPRPRGGGETVLVVEDGDDLRPLICRLLAAAGYKVIVASDGNDALEVAARHAGRVDLLLTDLVMPVMTGDAVATRMRQLYPGIRVLYMSGYAKPFIGADGAQQADYPVLRKPFSRSELLVKVVEILDQPAPSET